MDERAKDLLKFWLEEIGPERWFNPPPEIDDRIREDYASLWEEARLGRLDDWCCAPRSCLALVILLDQFPRNMFRGESRAFSSDAKALAIAKRAIRAGLDRRVPLDQRQFFYLPLMHSESVFDQDKCTRLHVMNFGESDNLRHALAHRNVIRRFGRFPFRNAALGRDTTGREAEFLADGGYEVAYAALRAQEPAAVG